METLLSACTIFLVMIGFLSCSGISSVAPPGIAQVKNVQWRLIAYDSLDGKMITLDSADIVVLFLEETRIVRGASHGRCGNDYSGVYSSSGGNMLRFDSLSSTEMGCPRSRYWEFFSHLPEVTSFVTDSSRLYLYTSSSSTRKLTFERAP